MIKDCKYFNVIQSIKFNKVQIKFNSNRIISRKKSYIDSISFVSSYNTDFTSSKNITKAKLLSKKQYMVQKVRNTYIASICQ